jgi:hypothetical protein
MNKGQETGGVALKTVFDRMSGVKRMTGTIGSLTRPGVVV